MQKFSKWLILSGATTPLFFFAVRDRTAPRDPLDFIGVNARDAVIISQKNNFFLTGNEDYIVLSLAPERLAEILAQFKTRPDFVWNSERVFHNRRGSREIKTFFEQAPINAKSGYFLVEKNENSENPPSTSCDFAADEKSGRLWIYALSSYN